MSFAGISMGKTQKFINPRFNFPIRHHKKKPSSFKLRNVAAQVVLFMILIVPSGEICLEFRTEDYSFLSSQVSTEKMMDTIRRLSGFGTRYVLTKECNESATFLFNSFSRLRSYNVSLHYFKLRKSDPEISPYKRYVSVNMVASKVGSLPGNRTMNEYVILCAHYDSISNQPYTSAPGAEDNAAGVAALMEIARILDTYPLDRTVLFIAFSGEEIGAQGSKAWASEHSEILSSTIAIICLDGIGRGKKIGIFYTFYGDLSSNSEELAELILTTAANLRYTNFRKQLSLKHGSDDLSFDGKARTVRLWDYDEEYIHTPLDTPDTIDADRLKQVVTVTLIATYKLATEPLDETLVPIDLLDRGSIKTIIAANLITMGISIAAVSTIKTYRRKRVTNIKKPRRGS